MAFGDIINKAKSAAQDFQDNRQEKAAEEAARKQAILSGQITPVQTSANLLPGEQAYLQLKAKRLAVVDTTIEHTKGKLKKKHHLGLRTKVKTTTTSEIESNVQQLDSGSLILTNQRVVFMGNNAISLPYDQILGFQFKHGLTGSNKAAIKYAGMIKGEFFELSGDGAKDTELYFQGISRNLLNK
jgi:hypothetical protein